jgi:hypothetical protein
LWDVAAPEERREIVILLLEPGGLYYDMEQKIIAALKPRPAFLPILRMLNGVVEYDEVRGLLITERWQDRNRRASNHRSPLARIPLEKLYSGRGHLLVYQEHTATSHPEMIPSLLPLTIRCWCLCLATLIPDLILAGRSRLHNGVPCSSVSSRQNHSVTSHLIRAYRMSESGECCGRGGAAQ